ncbi:TPA: endonuclease III [Candidatus Micrarchaeota archaeon]|nr:endonuclease III [Candidatus Micrarchaeota archaeon]
MAESKAKRKERALKILSSLKRAYPEASCSLDHSSPLELLISTILSAQCTDERVNKVTPALFARFRTARSFADADIAELESFARSTGFFRNKAKNIKAACRIISERHNGKVPKTMEEMLELPGVARKTANIVLGNAYGVIEGVPVDTHAIRLSRLMGLTKNHDQNKIERDLMKLIPREDWLNISNLFVHHGRAVCIARRPACSKCPVNKLCPKVGVNRNSMR